MKTFFAALVVFAGMLALASGFFSLSADLVEAQTASSGKWWYSYNPSVVSVNGNTGEMRAIWKGTAKICSQPSKSIVSPVQCYTVTVDSVVK